ncbi:LysR family transcriptional regulator [Paenarthrobacter sp. NPDC090522]|uniref:LysR family transcriptional regulator n=1 Tax=Paenarthrobacter sp. NPDC090522 TaxID=3364383 RepID=UPI0038170801
MSDFRRLQLLLELSQRGTISAVAAAMSYSTSGISQQLATLEAELGARLLEPDGRRLKLTPAGRALVSRIPQILENWESARAATLRGSQELAGKLRIAVFQTAYLSLVPGLVRELSVRHPRLELHTTQAEEDVAIPAVLSRELDAAIIEQYPAFPGPQHQELHRRHISNDPMLLAPPMGDTTKIENLASLSEASWVLEPSGSAVRDWAEALCRQSGFEPRVVFETSDVLTQVELVREGLAAAFVPTLMPERLRSGITVQTLQGQSRTIELVTRASRQDDPLFEALAEVLVINDGLGSAVHEETQSERISRA